MIAMSTGDLSEFTQPDAQIAEAHELHRALGPVHLTMIGIGRSSARASS